MPIKRAVIEKPKIEKAVYICLCCGVEKREDQFFTSRWSKVWNYSNHKVLFCKECLNQLFAGLSNRYNSEETALKICCAYLDVPYYGSMYKSISEHNSFFNIGLYLRQLQLGQFQYKCFLNSIVDGELAKSENQIRESTELKWSSKDKQNMNYALSIVGYDPFNDCGMTDNDRKYCFNILAGYCDTKGIQSDGHKIQSVVQITQSQLQCKKLDEFINAELLSTSPEEKRVKDWSATKKQLLDSIAKIAQDNNLSSAYNLSSQKGDDTFSNKIKEMSANNFEMIQVNLFGIKAAQAMKQIADLSNQSILEQLALDASDYSDMVKEQREMIVKFESENDALKEENRLLKNAIEELRSKKKRS